MQIFAVGAFLLGEHKRGRSDCIDEKLSIFIVEYGSGGESVVSSAMKMHMLQAECYLFQISFGQFFLEGPELFQQVFE